jgi:hypothetical protein
MTVKARITFSALSNDFSATSAAAALNLSKAVKLLQF